MKKPDHVIEIFLQPGEWYFGECDTRIRTVLGSCVSLTAWHPRLQIGGMCHYILPARCNASVSAPDGRYADEAFALLLREMRAAGTVLDEYRFKMFGGGNMFPRQSRSGTVNVGQKNGEAARHLLRLHGIQITSESLFGVGHRQIIFEVHSGDVWSRQIKPTETVPPVIE